MDSWKLHPAADHGLPLGERMRSANRESGLIGKISHLLWWRLVRLYLRLYHRLSVRGLENLPASAPFVIAANHASHLDALVLASAVPWRLRARVSPIAAGDTFFERPSTTLFAALALNALPLWRKSAGRHAMDQMRHRLIDPDFGGCIFVLFPEGTRSRTGEIGKFRAGLGMLVAETSVPVVPCHLRGAFEAMPPKVRMPRPRKIELTIGKPIAFADIGNRREGWDEIAGRIEAAVRGLGGATGAVATAQETPPPA